MQTAQRRIPIGGDDGKNKTWKELLDVYKRQVLYSSNLSVQLPASNNRAAPTVIFLKYFLITLAFSFRIELSH